MTARGSYGLRPGSCSGAGKEMRDTFCCKSFRAGTFMRRVREVGEFSGSNPKSAERSCHVKLLHFRNGRVMEKTSS